MTNTGDVNGTQDERLAEVGPAAEDQRTELAKFYLVIRAAVGVLGIALPTVLWIGEIRLNGTVSFRGSLSSYYHSAMRDVFVGTFWAIGILLVAYRAWKPFSWSFWLSLFGGLGAILLAFFPTARPEDPTTSCDDKPAPSDCAAMQTILGEGVSQRLHHTFTAVLLASVAGLCLYLAIWASRNRYPAMAVTQGICLVVMVVAVLWIGFGTDLGSGGHTLKKLYVGELLAMYAFAAAWLTEVGVLWRLIRRPVEGKRDREGEDFARAMVV